MSLTKEFTTPAEREYLNTLTPLYDLALAISFSSKEGLFKVLWPKVKYFFDFSYAEIIKIDEQYQRFSLRLTQALTQQIPAGTIIEGRYYNDRQNIITLIAN